MRSLAVGVLVLLLAGCQAGPDPLSDGSIRAAYPDATHRFTNITDTSEHETSYRIGIPESANRLTVKAVYRTNGDGSFVLKVPSGNGAKFDTFTESRSLEEHTWYDVREPDAGKWALSAHLTRGGSYTFGVYVR